MNTTTPSATTTTAATDPAPAPAPAAKTPKHHGLLDKHQLAEISKTSTLVGPTVSYLYPLLDAPVVEHHFHESSANHSGKHTRLLDFTGSSV